MAGGPKQLNNIFELWHGKRTHLRVIFVENAKKSNLVHPNELCIVFYFWNFSSKLQWYACKVLVW
jgi:hypothetical protein